MGTYRIVRWNPGQPDAKQLASGQVFTDIESAEQIKAKMQKYLPRVAFEIVTESSTPDPELRSPDKSGFGGQA